MQPILAESAPHRGRAIVFAIVLALVAMIALVVAIPAQHPRSKYRGHHRLPGTGKCPYVTYVHVTH